MSGQRTQLYLVIGVLVAVAVCSALVSVFASDSLADWFVEIGATFIGAFAALVGGLWLFEYQQGETTRTRRDEFRGLVRAELEETSERLPSSGATALNPETTLDYVSPLALEEAVKSGLFSPSLSKELMALSRQFHTYNTKVSNVLSYRHLYDEDSKETWDRLQSSRKGAANQAVHVVELCTKLLKHEELSEPRKKSAVVD